MVSTEQMFSYVTHAFERIEIKGPIQYVLQWFNFIIDFPYFNVSIWNGRFTQTTKEKGNVFKTLYSIGVSI